MITKEIKHFALNIGEYSPIECDAPTSVVTALVKKNILPEPYSGEHFKLARGAVSDGASFVAEFELDTLLFGMDNIEIRVGGVTGGCLLLINGVPQARLENTRAPYTLNIRAAIHLGKNTLELRYDAHKVDPCQLFEDISIYSPIELVAYNTRIIDNIVISEKMDGDLVRLTLRLSTKGKQMYTRAVASLVSPGGAVSYTPIIDGLGEMEIKAPNFWWPGALGTHNLYNLSVNLYSENELIDSREVNIGLAIPEYHKSSKTLTLSGIPLHPMPLLVDREDIILARRSHYSDRLKMRRAMEAGVNLIYINTREAYPSKDTLDAADEYGIILATRLVYDKRVENEVDKKLLKAEITRALLPLTLHPSCLIIYGLPEHEDIVRELISEYLPMAVYIPELEPTLLSASPSLPTPPVRHKYLGKKERNIFSEAILSRGKNDVERLLNTVAGEYLMPSSFDAWCYMAERVSERELCAAIADIRVTEHYELGYAASSLSEPIPAFSASILDYENRCKASYYALRRSSRDCAVFAANMGMRVSFVASNLSNKVYDGKLTYSVLDNKNREIMRETREFSVLPHSSSVIFDVDLTDIISGHEREYYLAFFASDSRGIHSEDTLLFAPERAFSLLDPAIKFELTGTGNDYTITLHAENYARGVQISVVGEEDVTLGDNHFDITSAIPVRIPLHTERPTAHETLIRELAVSSLYDAAH